MILIETLRKNAGKIGLSILVAVLLFAFVAQFVNWSEFWTKLAQTRPLYLLAALGFFLVYQALRAWRMVAAVPSIQAQPRLVGTFCLQAALNNFLPIGFGELALSMLMRRIHAVDIVKAGTIVFALRALDVLVLCMMFLLSAPWLLRVVPPILFWIVAAICVLGLAGGGLLLVSARRARQSNEDFLEQSDPTKNSGQTTDQLNLVGKIRRRARRIFTRSAVALDQLSQEAKFWQLVGSTFALWGIMWCVTFMVVRAIQLDLTVIEATAVYLVKFPVDLLPIKGFAGFGTHETAWLAILHLIGKPDFAGYAAVASHIVMLFIALLSALFGLVWLMVSGFSKKQKIAPVERDT